MRFALVNNTTNVVENVIIWNLAQWQQPDWAIVVQSDTAQIGDVYDPATNTFTTPAP